MGLFAEFNGFGMSTPSAPGGASIIVAATKWRQHVAVDVSPQNRFAFRIKPRSGDRNDRCRHFVAFEFWAVNFLWTYVHSYTLSPLSWLVCRTQRQGHSLISQRCGTARFPPLNSARSLHAEGWQWLSSGCGETPKPRQSTRIVFTLGETV